ncbi:hypothetical protein Gogos_003718 [Gossypium gossypioides]|uniref:O-methyltransferase C-terminal domain-containing protein n=1 Tax=Gossypium gossypioides TaxID=34282 RepID=A0A7J9CN29_GOSGO|nr:hypothetical protein [Gossypium gossypioides]
MINLSKISVKKILEKYHGFQGITTLVDVGGGYGGDMFSTVPKADTIMMKVDMHGYIGVRWIQNFTIEVLHN